VTKNEMEEDGVHDSLDDADSRIFRVCIKRKFIR
jgi:hypothetical protein